MWVEFILCASVPVVFSGLSITCGHTRDVASPAIGDSSQFNGGLNEEKDTR